MTSHDAHQLSTWAGVWGSRGGPIRDPDTPTPTQHVLHNPCPQHRPHVGTATESQGWPLRDQGQDFGDRAGLGMRTHLRSQAWSPPSRGGSGRAATASAGGEESQSEGGCGAGARLLQDRGQGLSSALTVPGPSAFCSGTPLSPFILPAQELGKGTARPPWGGAWEEAGLTPSVGPVGSHRPPVKQETLSAFSEPVRGHGAGGTSVVR